MKWVNEITKYAYEYLPQGIFEQNDIVFHVKTWKLAKENIEEILEFSNSNPSIALYCEHEVESISDFVYELSKYDIKGNVNIYHNNLSFHYNNGNIFTHQCPMMILNDSWLFTHFEDKTLSSKEYIDSKKEKFFLTFNFRCTIGRAHRIKLLSYIKKENIIDDTFFSALVFGNPKYYDVEIWDRTKKYELYSLKEYSEYFINNHPFKLDDESYSVIKDHRYHPKNFYSQSIFSIVTETYTSIDYLFITEKSLKPIVNCHPFLIIGNYSIHHKLQELGFYLYDDLIDYSFDLIEDDEERLYQSFLEIKRIHQLGKDYLLDWYKNNEDKIIYNKNHLINFHKQYII